MGIREYLKVGRHELSADEKRSKNVHKLLGEIKTMVNSGGNAKKSRFSIGSGTVKYPKLLSEKLKTDSLKNKVVGSFQHSAPGEKQSNAKLALKSSGTEPVPDAPSEQTKEGAEIKKGEIRRFKTGIPGFDSLLKDGVLEGSSVLVEGGPGSGKTIFCLQIANNACKKGLKTLYMSFEEPERRLREHMKRFGWEPEEYEKKGLLLIRRFNALDIARSVEALLSEAKRELLIEVQPVLIPKEFKPDIVCVDSLSSIASAFSGEESRFRVYMEQLFRYLESRNITAFLIRETINPTHIGTMYVEKGEVISFLSDGIIVLYNAISSDRRRSRAIEVLKMRGDDISRRIVLATIVDGKGFVIYPDEQVDGSFTLT